MNLKKQISGLSLRDEARDRPKNSKQNRYFNYLCSLTINVIAN